MATEKPRCIICAHKDFAPLALFFRKICNLRYIVLTHGIDVWDLKEGLKYNGLKNADMVVSVSQYTKDRIVENGIEESKIKLLQDTIDVSFFRRKDINQELLHKLTLGNRRVLLTVGRIDSSERYKGHDVMLDVLRELDEGYVWLVIGSGDDLPRLRQNAENMGVIEKVRFLGHVENNTLVDYYNLCDVFVMPSKGEGFGIAFLEAMACGKTVIGGNRDGSTEPFMNGKLGFMVDPDSAEEITRTINLAFTVKEDRTNPEYLSREVNLNFGIEVFNKKVREIFGDMAS